MSPFRWLCCAVSAILLLYPVTLFVFLRGGVPPLAQPIARAEHLEPLHQLNEAMSSPLPTATPQRTEKRRMYYFHRDKFPREPQRGEPSVWQSDEDGWPRTTGSQAQAAQSNSRNILTGMIHHSDTPAAPTSSVRPAEGEPVTTLTDDSNFGLRQLGVLDAPANTISELQTELAVVMPTFPRQVRASPAEDVVGWWLHRFAYIGPSYRSLDPDSSLETMASTCKNDPRCDGFAPDGRLFSRIGVGGVQGSSRRPGMHSVTSRRAFYTKERVSLQPRPRFVASLEGWKPASAGDPCTLDDSASECASIAPSRSMLEQSWTFAPAQDDDATVEGWWEIWQTDVVGHEIGQAEAFLHLLPKDAAVAPSVSEGGDAGTRATGLGSGGSPEDILARRVCERVPRCMAVNSRGWLFSSADPTLLTTSTTTSLWVRSKGPPLPMDYITASLLSIRRELRDAAVQGPCGETLLAGNKSVDLEQLNALDFSKRQSLLETDAAIGSSGNHGGRGAKIERPGSLRGKSLTTLQDLLDRIQNRAVRSKLATEAPRREPTSTLARQPAHVYVINTAPPFNDARFFPTAIWDAISHQAKKGYPENTAGFQVPPNLAPPRGHHSDYPGLYALWRQPSVRSDPCFTFLDAAQFPRYVEEHPPPDGKGMPRSNGRSKRKRAEVAQALGIVAALEEAHRRSPNADVLVWEDDCHMCKGTLSALSEAVDVGALDRGALVKVGNGGSGILIPQRFVSAVTNFIKTRRGSDNVDVCFWRWAKEESGVPDLLSYYTWSAHRGLRSSLRPQGWTSGLWGRVECGNELDFYWGEYSPHACARVLHNPNATKIDQHWRCAPHHVHARFD